MFVFRSKNGPFSAWEHNIPALTKTGTPYLDIRKRKQTKVKWSAAVKSWVVSREGQHALFAVCAVCAVRYGCDCGVRKWRYLYSKLSKRDLHTPYSCYTIPIVRFAYTHEFIIADCWLRSYIVYMLLSWYSIIFFPYTLVYVNEQTQHSPMPEWWSEKKIVIKILQVNCQRTLAFSSYHS